MTDKQRAAEIVRLLKQEYQTADCTLDYESAWQLLVSVRLAAQCTDLRVNAVAPVLFSKYDTPLKLSQASEDDIESIVRPCGLGRTKARDIKAAMTVLCRDYGGHLPKSFDELMELPGVGRKSANLIMGDVYGKPAIVTDTHCIRLANRMGLANSKQPYAVEKQLAAVVEPSESNDFCHRLVMHGRAVCKAAKPNCEGCCLGQVCLKRL